VLRGLQAKKKKKAKGATVHGAFTSRSEIDARKGISQAFRPYVHVGGKNSSSVSGY